MAQKTIAEMLTGTKKPTRGDIGVICTITLDTGDGTGVTEIEAPIINAVNPTHEINMGTLTPAQYYAIVTDIRKGLAKPSPTLTQQDYLLVEAGLRRAGVTRPSSVLNKLIEAGFMGIPTVDGLLDAITLTCDGMNTVGVEAYKAPFFDAAMMTLGAEGEKGIRKVMAWCEKYGSQANDLSGKTADIELLTECIANNQPIMSTVETDDTVLVNITTGEITPDDPRLIKAALDLLQ